MKDSAVTCRVCGTVEQLTEHKIREMNFGSREIFPYLECTCCGSLQIRTVPGDLARYYPPDYLGSGQQADAEDTSFRGIVRSFVRRQHTAYLLGGLNPIGWAAAKWRSDQFTPHLRAVAHAGVPKSARVLDVGCGPGHVLQRMSEIGYSQLTGQDPFQSWTLPSVKVVSDPLDELRGKFDLIMLHHSFEHVPDPLATLERLKALTAPSGMVLMRTPVASQEAWDQYRTDWYQIDAPRHLVVPSKKGLESLAQQVGFEIERIIYDSDETQFLCSEQYRRDIPLRDSRSYYSNPSQALFQRSEVAAAKRRAAQANTKGTGDQACFYLRAP